MSIIITDENRAQWQEKRDEAQDVLGKWMLGLHENELTYDGETVKYSQTNENRIRRWIAEIEAALGMRRATRVRSRAVNFR